MQESQNATRKYLNKYLSGFDKRYHQKFLATVLFEACSVLDHSFFNDLFSTKVPLKAAVDKKTCVKYAVYIFPTPPPQLSPTYHFP